MPKITFLNKPDPVLLGRFCDAVEQWKADQEFAAYKAKQAELAAEESPTPALPLAALGHDVPKCGEHEFAEGAKQSVVVNEVSS